MPLHSRCSSQIETDCLHVRCFATNHFFWWISDSYSNQLTLNTMSDMVLPCKVCGHFQLHMPIWSFIGAMSENLNMVGFLNEEENLRLEIICSWHPHSPSIACAAGFGPRASEYIWYFEYVQSEYWLWCDFRVDSGSLLCCKVILLDLCTQNNLGDFLTKNSHHPV